MIRRASGGALAAGLLLAGALACGPSAGTGEPADDAPGDAAPGAPDAIGGAPAVPASADEAAPGPAAGAACLSLDPLPPAAVTPALSLAPDGCAEVVVDAAGGELLELRVEQLGVDLVVHLRAPSGRQLAGVDTPFRGFGTEVVTVVAEEDGRHLLTVRAGGRSSGRFVIRRGPYRPATPADRRRAAAHAALAEADDRFYASDLAAADELLVPLAAAADRLGDPFLRGEARHRQALVALTAGRTRRAAGYAATAARHFATAGDLPRLATALGLRGHALFEAGEVTAARHSFEASSALYEDPGSGLAADPAGRAGALHNLAHAWQWEGYPQRALEGYDRAIAIARRSGEPFREAESRHNRGFVRLELGRLDAAGEDFRAAADLWDELGQPARAAESLDKLGAVRLRRTEPRAVDHLRRVLRLRDRRADPRGWAVTVSQLGLAWRRRGEPLAALTAYRAALRALGVEADPAPGHGASAGSEAGLDAGSRRVAAVALHNLALVERDLGEPSAPRLHRALRLYRDLADTAGEASVRTALARDHRRRGELDAARRQAEAALDLHELRRARPDDVDLRADGFATVQRDYELATSIRMDLHRLDPGAGHAAAALEIGERARARSLLDLRLASRHRGGGGHGTGASRSVPVAAEPLRADDLRRRFAAPGTALLVYGLADDASHLWVVDADGLSTFRLAPRRELEAAAERLAGLLAVSHRVESRTALAAARCAAGRLLLEPAASRLAGARRLVVVADGALATLPFAALPEPAGSLSTVEPPTAGCAGRPPLVAGRIVTQPPSASLADRPGGGGGSNGAAGPVAPATTGRGPVIVFADPVYDLVSDPVKAPGDPGRTAAGRGAAALPRLAASAAEAEAIAAIGRSAPDAAGGEVEVRLHLGLDATPEAVAAAVASRPRVLHFAVHAAVDPDRPEASALRLSRFAAGGRPQDGDLTAGAVRRLPVSCDLVVLSACRSGVGRRLPGEGMLGLGRAFLEAGAGAVLVSLWPVDDAATAELMGRFYGGLLGAGLDPAEALARAQRSLAAEPGRAPYHWAGFVLQG